MRLRATLVALACLLATPVTNAAAVGPARESGREQTAASATSSEFEPRADPFSEDPATERGYLLLGGLTAAVVGVGLLFARQVRRAQARRTPDSRYVSPRSDRGPLPGAGAEDG